MVTIVTMVTMVTLVTLYRAVDTQCLVIRAKAQVGTLLYQNFELKTWAERLITISTY